MISAIICFSLVGLILGLIYGLGYCVLFDMDNNGIIVSCIVFGVCIGGLFGAYIVTMEQKINKLPEVLTELNNTKLELERIKQQAVAAGLGYWHEELAVVRRDFVIASQTASFTAEAK